MPNRPWTNADNVKLRSLAGKIPTKEIAAQLGRSMGATVVQASAFGSEFVYRSVNGKN